MHRIVERAVKLGPARRDLESVAMAMWPAYMNSAQSNAEQAEIVRDRFHIRRRLDEAVDKVCRQEHKTLKQAGDT